MVVKAQAGIRETSLAEMSAMMASGALPWGPQHPLLPPNGRNRAISVEDLDGCRYFLAEDGARATGALIVRTRFFFSYGRDMLEAVMLDGTKWGALRLATYLRRLALELGLDVTAELDLSNVAMRKVARALGFQTHKVRCTLPLEAARGVVS